MLNDTAFMFKPKTLPEPIRAPHSDPEQLKNYWARFYEEVPVCSHPGCGSISVEVDPLFPYLDDLNRCPLHHDEQA
ncbi:MAG: hypothetical protein HY423_08255 [Candidatus Lambdaproteobacteria bacterium]|nr:hypothetical protein [Candidatus Lambdaproteobacteria bacterium]